jgi:hypothetical protein
MSFPWAVSGHRGTVLSPIDEISDQPMMFSVPAGNALTFCDANGVVLDTPITTALNRDVVSPSTELS